MNEIFILLILVDVLTTGINVAILMIVVKLYTELVKHKFLVDKNEKMV